MYFQSHDNTVILISRIKATFIVINIVNPANNNSDNNSK